MFVAFLPCHCNTNPSSSSMHWSPFLFFFGVFWQRINLIFYFPIGNQCMRWIFHSPAAWSCHRSYSACCYFQSQSTNMINISSFPCLATCHRTTKHTHHIRIKITIPRQTRSTRRTISFIITTLVRVTVNICNTLAGQIIPLYMPTTGGAHPF